MANTQPHNDALSYQINRSNDSDNFFAQVVGQIPSIKVKYGNRRMLKWLVPERGIVSMYINPQQIRIQKTKIIRPERTKGGFVVQYWGEDLYSISIEGHTGSSGIEGMNLLDDVYRNEQVVFDNYALEAAANLQNEDDNFIRALIPGVGEVEDFILGLTDTSKNTGLVVPKPTLAYFACSVEMYWMGETYRGFFENVNITESAERLGIFAYSISFKATQKRGFRRNNLPWQYSVSFDNPGPSGASYIPLTYPNETLPASNVSQTSP